MKNKPKHNHFIIRDLDDNLILESDYHGRVELKVIY